MRTTVAALALCLLPLAVQANERTVSWYAARPEARAAVIARCEDDPGRLSHHPDCVNARRGEVKATADALAAERGRLPQPRPGALPPSWFSARPAFRQTVVGNCRRMDAAQRARYRQCESAERSFLEAARR